MITRCTNGEFSRLVCPGFLNFGFRGFSGYEGKKKRSRSYVRSFAHAASF